MSKLMILMASVVMTGVAFSGVTTHFALNTYAQSGIQLVSAESTLAVDYSPYFSMAKDKATVRVLTNGAVWVESAVGGKMDFTFGDIGLFYGNNCQWPIAKRFCPPLSSFSPSLPFCLSGSDQ